MILAGFQQLVFNHSLGGTYVRPVRAVVFHTTEGTTVQGAVSVYKTKIACPHLTVDPETFEKFQHVPLDSSCYALQRGDANHVCGVQTNRSGVIQIEVVGYAGEAWSWSQQRLEWLGVEVLKPILDAYPSIPHAVYSGPRMNETEWDTWPGGLAGHADVCCQPAGHWDPGDLDLQRILDYATGDDMALSDDDVKRIVEAMMARPMDIEGYKAPFAEWIGYIYAEVTRPEKLTKRVVDAIAKVAIIVDEGH